MLSNGDMHRLQTSILHLQTPVPSTSVLPAETDSVDIDDLPIGAKLEVDTGHTTYRLENRGQGQVLISGHPEFCPEPVLVEFQGAVGGPALLRLWHIEPGLKMAFQHPVLGTVRTSRVRAIRHL